MTPDFFLFKEKAGRFLFVEILMLIAVATFVIAYGLIAAVLPVWLLLAPRDYLSTFMKLGTIFALVLGVHTTADRPLGFDQVVALCPDDITRDQARTASAVLCRDGQLERIRSGVYQWADGVRAHRPTNPATEPTRPASDPVPGCGLVRPGRDGRLRSLRILGQDRAQLWPERDQSRLEELGQPNREHGVGLIDRAWLALPDGKEELDPAFDHVPGDGLPLVEAGGASARVLMGTLWGATAATPCHSPTIYADIVLTAGSSLSIDSDADERAVMLVGGAAELDGQPLEPFALYVLAPGHTPRLTSSSEARAMLMGGGAFATPRHVFWNFVSSSRDRINRAKDDWKARRFPLIPGDDQEFIPLPEVPTTVSYP
jgi:hypothetical protein